MTKRHLQSDKEREVNGQTAILAKRLAAAERERDEALDALRMRVIDAQFWAKQCEILVQERNEARAQLAEAQKTPDEWCRLLGVSIADPDGWRSEGDPPWEQPLGYDDFSRRAMRSSQLAPANPALLQEEIATLRAQLADAQRQLDEADEHLKIERQAKGVTTAKCLRCEYVRLASYLLCPMCCHVGEVENERNEARAQLAEARLSPWLLAETLEDTTAQHDPLPAPPIAEIDSLRAQLAEARQETTDLHTEIDGLHTRLAERSRDSERLDWMQENGMAIFYSPVAMGSDGFWKVKDFTGEIRGSGDTLRSAIDAAMHDDSAEPEEESS